MTKPCPNRDQPATCWRIRCQLGGRCCEPVRAALLNAPDTAGVGDTWVEWRADVQTTQLPEPIKRSEP